MRHALVGGHEAERRLDQGLGVGTRIEGRLRDLEGPAIELPLAQDACDRLAREAARNEHLEPCDGIWCNHALRIGDQGFMANFGCLLQEEPGIERRRRVACSGEGLRRHAQQVSNSLSFLPRGV